MALVDFHTHFFSRTFFETLARQSPLAGSVEEKLSALAQRTGLELPSADEGAHLQRWLAQMDAHGVSEMASFASVPEELSVVARAARDSKGRLHGFALVNPRVEGAAEKLSGALDGRGIQGVLLFPALHGYSVDGVEARPLLQLLQAQRAICYVHCGLLVVKLRDLLGLPRTQNLALANPLAVVPVANAFPHVAFVIPHFGAGFLRETLLAGAQCENVYVDSSSSNSWLATQSPKPSLREVFERALEVFGPARVLFGTDSSTFPAGWRRERYEEQRLLLEKLGASAADQEAIFGGNARRLFTAAAHAASGA